MFSQKIKLKRKGLINRYIILLLVMTEYLVLENTFFTDIIFMLGRVIRELNIFLYSEKIKNCISII